MSSESRGLGSGGKCGSDRWARVKAAMRMYWQAGNRDARINAIPSVRFSVTTMMQGLRRRLEPVLRRLFHLYWRFARGMTLGVRAVVLDGDTRVFLVKHSYVSGWHLPGGGVEVGESFHDALCR